MESTIKHVIKEFDLICELEKTKQFKIESENELNKKKSWLKKQTPKGYLLSIKSNTYFKTKSDVNFFLKTNRFNLKIENAFVNNISHSASLKGSSHSCEIKIYSFRSIEFEKNSKYYCKQIIPIEDKSHFLYIINDSVYTSDDGIISRGLIHIKLNLTENFEIYIKEFNKKSYLIIECSELMDPREFKNCSWSIVFALSYFMSYLMQNECYYFYYKEHELNHFNAFEYSQLRDSINSIYEPVNSNPYGWVRDKLVAEKYEEKIAKVSIEQFSKFANLLHNESVVKGIILLIIECSNRSLLLMPAGYSVALESLTQYFYEKYESTLKPIPDKEIADAFKDGLKKVLINLKDSIPKDGFEIIEKKISNINSPTNRDKLKAPFKILNIELSSIDETVLEHRNDFLHGNIILKTRGSKKNYNMNEFEISLRLMTLLNSIILKMIGYEGYILNHVKLQEKGLNKVITEDPYKKI